MGNHYKCRRCGAKIYIDAGEPRFCDKCMEELGKGGDADEVRKEDRDPDGSD